MTRLLPLVFACLAFAACKREPKTVTAVGYTFTVPASWNAEPSEHEGFRQVSFDEFDFDGTCMVQVFNLALEPEAWVETMENVFKARGKTASTFKSTLGTFEGATFEGTIPSDTAMGKVAQLAGPPHVEAYALRREKETVGLMITTLGDERERRGSRATCAAVLASMRVAAPAR
ncbi:MAG: hypothetical protein Q8L14_21680 [Myxococcales bacterium]|nr:hypothetical protein [Myxococcales bacterium]